MRWKSSADTSCRRGCATILLMPAALTSTSSRPSERTAVSTRRSFAVAALIVCSFNRSHGGLQKIEQQPVHRSGLLLLHPVAGAIDQLAAEHARAGARLHRLEVAGLLEHAPVAGA